LDQVVTHIQPQTGPVCRRFGGKKRVEYVPFRVFPHPAFIIANLNDGMILPVVSGNGVLFTQNPSIENEIDL
jgi:hypothetical protein